LGISGGSDNKGLILTRRDQAAPHGPPDTDMQHNPPPPSKTPTNDTLARQGFKQIARRATDKVLAGLPAPNGPGAPPDTKPGAEAYWQDPSRRLGVQRVVDAYVTRFVEGGGA